MAEIVYLRLVVDGTVIEGDSSKESFDRGTAIECLSFEWSARGSRSWDPRQSGHKITHEPVTVRKAVDRSSPLLIKAMVEQEPVQEAEFRFFRPDPQDGGHEQHYATVRLDKAGITHVGQISECSTASSPQYSPMTEEIRFNFGAITWTYEPTGATYRVVLPPVRSRSV